MGNEDVVRIRPNDRATLTMPVTIVRAMGGFSGQVERHAEQEVRLFEVKTEDGVTLMVPESCLQRQ